MKQATFSVPQPQPQPPPSTDTKKCAYTTNTASKKTSSKPIKLVDNIYYLE